MSVTQLNDRIGCKSAHFKLPLRKRFLWSAGSDPVLRHFFTFLLVDPNASKQQLWFWMLWDQLVSHISEHLCEMHLCTICSCLQCGMKNEVLSKRRTSARLRSPYLFDFFALCFSILCLLIFAYYMTYAFAGISYELNRSMERFNLWPDGGITVGCYFLIPIHRT